MLGLMQQRPLLISTLIDYAATYHGDREIVSRDPEGAFHRTDFAGIARRAKQLAGALNGLDVAHGERVATLAWNSFRHLEIYYGVTSSGRVLHTVNPRLFPEQIQYILHHAESAYVFFDPIFAPLVEQLAPLRLAFIHVVEGATGGPRDFAPFDYGALRVRFKRGNEYGAWMVNNGYTRSMALEAVASGTADMVAFGKLFISNPDLVSRLRDGAPLASLNSATLYGGDARGYTDYPALDTAMA